MAEGYHDFTAGETLTAANLEDYCESQSIMRFASSGARDSALSAVKVPGMPAYIKSNDAAEGLVLYNSANVWRKPWNMPWGVVASSIVWNGGSDQSITGASLVDITDAAATLTVVANRLYRYSAAFYVSATSLGLIAWNIAGTDIVSEIENLGTSSTLHYATSFLDTTAAGSRTVKLRCNPSSGTVTIKNSYSPGFFVVEDLGPTGAPS